MKIQDLVNKLLFLGVIGLSVFLLFFVICVTWIGYEVKDNCQQAKRQYGSDCVISLTRLLNDNNNSYRVRNSAIWALGQIGDRRALPTLKKYYTGKIPDHESLDKTISQYELKKAVNLTSGGLNITAIFWRFNI